MENLDREKILLNVVKLMDEIYEDFYKIKEKLNYKDFYKIEEELNKTRAICDRLKQNQEATLLRKD